MKCTDCDFCVTVDSGYSNFTVMGTSLHCGKELHPEDGFDLFYGVDTRNDFANKCGKFQDESGSVEISVDGRPYDIEEAEQYATRFLSAAEILKAVDRSA